MGRVYCSNYSFIRCLEWFVADEAADFVESSGRVGRRVQRDGARLELELAAAREEARNAERWHLECLCGIQRRAVPCSAVNSSNRSIRAVGIVKRLSFSYGTGSQRVNSSDEQRADLSLVDLQRRRLDDEARGAREIVRPPAPRHHRVENVLATAQRPLCAPQHEHVHQSTVYCKRLVVVEESVKKKRKSLCRDRARIRNRKN